jgi:thiamine-phosphate pyrophosphorylase
VITDPTLAGGLSHEEIARLAIKGGADAIQLRDKNCAKQDLVATGRHIRKVTRDANVLFVVNDWLDVALSCGADGVHLGQSDLQVREARAHGSLDKGLRQKLRQPNP